ncbi:MAG: superoxide dismutase family protein [Gemmatimonadales bacterium]
MTRFSALSLLLLLGACHSRSTDSTSPTPAGSVATHAASRVTFAIIDSAGRRVGQVSAVETGAGVQLDVFVAGMPPGMHGMHLHDAGLCEAPAFTTAAGHLNPASRQHGHKNPLGAHQGDLPNLVIDPKGVGRARVLIAAVTLQPPAPSIAGPGTALVIHADPDDELTDPTGNSGVRIACGVITDLHSRYP